MAQGLEARAAEIHAHTTRMIQTSQWREGKIPNSTRYLKEARYDAAVPGTRTAFKDDDSLAQIFKAQGVIP